MRKYESEKWVQGLFFTIKSRVEKKSLTYPADAEGLKVKYSKCSLSHFYKAEHIGGAMLLFVVLRHDLKDLGGTLAGLDLSERWKGVVLL